MTRPGAARESPSILPPDLKQWTFGSKIDGFFECPDLFELAVDGEPGKKRWVLHAADGKYVLGDFDGRAFHITSGKDKRQLWYGNFYQRNRSATLPITAAFRSAGRMASHSPACPSISRWRCPSS